MMQRSLVGPLITRHSLRRPDVGESAVPFVHQAGVKPSPSAVELGCGADGIVFELQDHPELVVKEMNHPFRLGRNRIKLEIRVLSAVIEATNQAGATRVFNSGTDESEHSWLVRERVFDVFPRGTRESREKLFEIIMRIFPSADVNRAMLPDPTFDNVRWGFTEANAEPRWILIDP
jgi:hypothetical protein